MNSNSIVKPELNADEWYVEEVPLKTCVEMVIKYHYAKGGSNTATYRHGLFRRGNSECQGIAWWIPPTKSAAISSYPEGDWKTVLALSRFVLSPDVPKNGASFLISKSIKIIKKEKRFECLVTYADLYQNHLGTIYKASNWEYVGMTKPEAVWVDKSGKMVARKTGPKTRTKDEMLSLGYINIGRFSKHKFRLVLKK